MFDDVDEAQALPDMMNAYLLEVTYGLQRSVDAELAVKLASEGTFVTGFGTPTTPIEVKSSNI